MSGKILVEVLHSPTWDDWPTARAAVDRVARGEHLTVEIMEELVPSREAAERRRFPGSPTIRVEGRDLLPEVEAWGDFGLG